MDFTKLKIAIVCDWLKDWGWAEQVLYDMLEVLPNAHIYSSIFDAKNFPELEGCVRTTFIQKIPFLRNRPKLIPFLRTYAFESLDLSDYDLVISSSSAESKWIVTSVDTLHVCYCHAVTRYYWGHTHAYQRNPEFGWLNPLARTLMPYLLHRLRIWDSIAADRVDAFISNSIATKRRISKYYRRDSELIYPGIDEELYAPGKVRSDYFLAVGRIIPYKRFDLLVETFNQNGLPLRILTNQDNELHRELKRKSNSNIEWILQESHEQKIQFYQEAKALVFPQEEDFGLVPVESMLCGTPVIAYAKWWACETVREGVSGIFFHEQTPESFQWAIDSFQRNQFSVQEVRNQGLNFTKRKFQSELLFTLERLLNAYSDAV